MIRSARLVLCALRDRHGDAFAAMHADAAVMADHGGPILRSQSDAKLSRYQHAARRFGVSRMAVETPQGGFLGYCVIMVVARLDHPLGLHHEIGWRFRRSAWGQGFATESAAAILRWFGEAGKAPLFAYTSAENLRSRAVMRRLCLQRMPGLDFGRAPHAGQQGMAVCVWCHANA